MFPPKDPEEEITISFNFAGQTTSVSNPTISVTVYSGTDASPQDLIDDTPQVLLSTFVAQRIIGGLNLVNYLFRCKATAANGDVIVMTEILPVRTFPYTS